MCLGAWGGHLGVCLDARRTPMRFLWGMGRSSGCVLDTYEVSLGDGEVIWGWDWVHGEVIWGCAWVHGGHL